MKSEILRKIQLYLGPVVKLYNSTLGMDLEDWEVVELWQFWSVYCGGPTSDSDLVPPTTFFLNAIRNFLLIEISAGRKEKAVLPTTNSLANVIVRAVMAEPDIANVVERYGVRPAGILVGVCRYINGDKTVLKNIEMDPGISSCTVGVCWQAENGNRNEKRALDF